MRKIARETLPEDDPERVFCEWIAWCTEQRPGELRRCLNGFGLTVPEGPDFIGRLRQTVVPALRTLRADILRITDGSAESVADLRGIIRDWHGERTPEALAFRDWLHFNAGRIAAACAELGVEVPYAGYGFFIELQRRVQPHLDVSSIQEEHA